ncbi:translation initiation factor eIF 4e-like domain-containing protein [Lentinula aff. lateritia]|uniref:Translation initiation factor eIF 4e-like domain-containing protein n=1 Tax=Lentinula aff. lateritia TaxID=2804960 RepID=A0ACC1UFY6_9AGAR|nr:translation initiation factor eIF 4e-like domain-containing protein [Lentinula aff. lateritia]
MTKANEDAIPEGDYKYAWTPTSNVPLEDFLSKYKPSMVENDGTKPWIWVRKGGDTRSFTPADEIAVLEESSKILTEITDQIENIKNDPSIPTRSNKKTGAKSKKEVREELQRDARERFEQIARKHNYLSGKWLMFASTEKIDMIWSSLATSLITGPLADTNAFCAKVATTPRDANTNHLHVICLYFPDVYNKDAVTKAMKILLRNHGFNLSGVKSDMYTLLGIDSKHPSGIPSTIWKNKDLMDDKEIQALKDAFFAELKGGKSSIAQSPDKADSNDKKPMDIAAPSADKLRTKRKQKDVFASDDDDDDNDGEQKRRAELMQKKKAIAVSKRRSDKDKDSDEEQEKPKRKAARRS